MTPPAPAADTSALEVRLVDPLADPDWDRWVAGHPAGGPFHGSAWARVLVRSYGHRPLYVLLHRGGTPVVMLPLMEVDSPLTGRRGVCVPFADCCGPLVFGSGASRPLADVLLRLADMRAWRHVEVRGAEGLPAGAVPSVSFSAHELDLRPGPERLHAAFDSAVRRALRKAEAEGVEVRIRTDRDAIRVFEQLHAGTRRRHGLPPQPARFFEAIYQEFIASGSGAVVLASHRDAPAAAAVFLLQGRKAIYKFGADEDRARATRANNLAMWHGIQWLGSSGVDILHLGRTSRSQDGLRRYKRGWGAVESVLPYFKLQPPALTWLPGQDRASGRHTFVFSRLPLPVNRFLGTLLYPHLD